MWTQPLARAHAQPCGPFPEAGSQPEPDATRVLVAARAPLASPLSAGDEPTRSPAPATLQPQNLRFSGPFTNQARLRTRTENLFITSCSFAG